MQSFRAPFLYWRQAHIVRETLADMGLLEQRHAEIRRAIIENRARLAGTRDILQRIDAALARFNCLR